MREMEKEFKELAEECSASNWDGYNAYPISEDSLKHAKRFIALLPDDISDPELACDPDGAVCFDWGDNQFGFSLSFEADGRLCFAGRFPSDNKMGVESDCNTIPFPEEIPELVLTYIRKVM